MDETYDVIVIGGGHNGLVTAALLGKAGLRVVVLEQRPMVGGMASSEEIWPGYRFNTGAHDIGLIPPKVSEALGLEGTGLQVVESEAAVFAPHPVRGSFTLWANPERSLNEISQHFPADGPRFLEYLSFMKRLEVTLSEILTRTPPDLPDYSFRDILSWAPLGVKLRRMGEQDMMAFFRMLPMSARDLLNEWFEDEFLKGVLAVPAISGGLPGPFQAGTAFMLLYQRTGSSGGYRSRRFVVGGMEKFAATLAKIASNHGVEIRCGVSVAKVVLDDDWERAEGVKLADGDYLRARTVVSNVDPRQTFFELVGGARLEPRFIREIISTAYGGGVARVNFALRDLPDFGGQAEKSQLGGYTVFSPDMDYMEKAWDDAKYGLISRQPVLEAVFPSLAGEAMAPAGGHSMSVTMNYAPYKLARGDWQTERENVGDLVLDMLKRVAPELPELILDRQVQIPLDWERRFGLTEGHVFHGQMTLDQLFFMRPIPGYAGYRTPFQGLYLCGSGTHPGGGVSGAPGYNAAREILRDWKTAGN